MPTTTLEAVALTASVMAVGLGLSAGGALLRERRNRRRTLAEAISRKEAGDEEGFAEAVRGFTIGDYVRSRRVRSLIDEHLEGRPEGPGRRPS